MSKDDFVKTDDFVVLSHSGTIDYLRALNIVWSAWKSGKLLGKKRVLVDLRDTIISHSFDYEVILHLAQELAEVTQGVDGLRIANVVPTDEDRVRIAKFAESAARCLGANYRFFTDYDEAAAWLRRTSDYPSISG
jgi:hypothetical protein